ncbi:hypothetical protein J3F83DRAFT_711566 [Trichoderma novae-zelandiae]
MLDHHMFVFGLVAASAPLMAAYPAAGDGVEGSMTTYVPRPVATATAPVFPGDGVEGSVTTMLGGFVTTSVEGSMTTMLTSPAPTAAPSAVVVPRDRVADLYSSLREMLDQLEEVADADNDLKVREAPSTLAKRGVFGHRQTADPMPTFTNDPPTHTADPMPTFTNDPPTHTADPMPTFTNDPPTHTADPMPTFTNDPPALSPDPMPTFVPDPTHTGRIAVTPTPVLLGLPDWWPAFVANATESVASRTSAASGGLPTSTLPPATGAAKKTAAPLMGAVVAAAAAYFLL